MPSNGLRGRVKSVVTTEADLINLNKRTKSSSKIRETDKIYSNDRSLHTALNRANSRKKYNESGATCTMNTRLGDQLLKKTLGLATNTMDRRDLNDSINHKYKLQNDSINRSIPSNNHAAPKRDSSASNKGVLVHKRSQTANENLLKKLEEIKPDKNQLVIPNQLSKTDSTNMIDRYQNYQRPASKTGENSGSKLMKPRSASALTDINNEEQESQQALKRPKKVEAKKRNYLHIESIRKFSHHLPPFEAAKVVIKDFDRIKGFGVNTHQGTVRAYNEDRVSILLNAQQRYV